MSDQEVLVQNLKLLHKSHSYRGLADHIGVAPNTVRRWLTARSQPSKLASARIVQAMRRLTRVTSEPQETSGQASS